MPASTVRRFWAKVRKTDGCWLWTAAKTSKGYGAFGFGGGLYLAHRVAFVLAGKTIAPEMTLDHLCRNKLCVRPDHLEEVTRAENGWRAVRLTATEGE